MAPVTKTSAYLAHIREFFSDQSGAITVDWTVLSSAAISMALGTSTLLRDHSEFVATGMDNELRGGDLSDGWPNYTFDHFEPMITAGALTTEEAEALHDTAFDLMNHRVVTDLLSGIVSMEAGSLTDEQLSELISIASIAYHRDLADEEMLDHYFGFDGATPFYMTIDPTVAQTN